MVWLVVFALGALSGSGKVVSSPVRLLGGAALVMPPLILTWYSKRGWQHGGSTIPRARRTSMFNVIAMVWCLGMATTAAGQDAPVASGEKLLVAQKCLLCHSVGGKGNKKGPLDGVATKLTADEIREWIVDAKGMTAKAKSTRKPVMKPYALPKADVDALVAYLSTLKK
jgi:mono/diheme cytochrome c family protein